MSSDSFRTNLPRLQGELESIISRFKDNEYYRLSESKESTDFQHRPESGQPFFNQLIIKLKDRLQVMQDIIESLITDGNRMYHIYEEIILVIQAGTEIINEELLEAKRELQQQKIQSEKLVGEMGQRMDVLNRQIEIKEDEFIYIKQQYEELEEKMQEKIHIDTLQVKEIETQLLKESRKHQEIIELSQKKIQQVTRNLAQSIKEIQRLQNENYCLKNENQQLMFEYSTLLQSRKGNFARDAIIIDEKEDEKKNTDHQHKYEAESFHMESLHLDNFKLKSKKSSEQNLIVQQLSAMFVPMPLYTNSQKDMVNTSEIYFQFSTPTIHCSKFKVSEKNANLKRRANLIISRTLEIYIAGSTTRNKTITESIIEHSIRFQAENPYLAFFRLLVQCEKLNSPYFDNISHINISYLYDELIKKLIPFNQWQEEIRNVLEGKLKTKGAKGREYD